MHTPKELYERILGVRQRDDLSASAAIGVVHKELLDHAAEVWKDCGVDYLRRIEREHRKRGVGHGTAVNHSRHADVDADEDAGQTTTDDHSTRDGILSSLVRCPTSRDVCMMCDALGPDRRPLFLECLYDLHELLPEAIDTNTGAGNPPGTPGAVLPTHLQAVPRGLLGGSERLAHALCRAPSTSAAQLREPDPTARGRGFANLATRPPKVVSVVGVEQYLFATTEDGEVYKTHTVSGVIYDWIQMPPVPGAAAARRERKVPSEHPDAGRKEP